MRLIILLAAVSLAGCSSIERPYLKETITTTKDGSTVTTREYSADKISGAGSLKKIEAIGKQP